MTTNDKLDITMPHNLSLGKYGEDVAVDYLKKNKYSITERNFVLGKHELDIIAEDKNFIVFVEVKTRTYKSTDINAYGNPGRAVTSKKRSDTLAAVNGYLRTHSINKQPRIDVIEVCLLGTGDAPKTLKVNHIRNAFDAKGRKLH